MQNLKLKKIAYLFFSAVIVFGIFKIVILFLNFNNRELNFSAEIKNLTLNDNGIIFEVNTTANSVEALLKEKNIKLGEHDLIFPEKITKIFSGSQIEIHRAAKITIKADGKTIEGYAFGKSIEEALKENGINLSRLDQTTPLRKFPVENNSTIIVTRINVEEVVEKEDIDFKTTVKTDSKLGWREKKIEIKGEKGIREVKYEITYKNGKEVSRKTLEKKTVEEPVTQVEVQGSYMKLGKAATGQGTWYAFKGGLFAASTTLPRGSYAKVTNTANGKTVIVQINDYGPQGKGRIIDLDKVAFAKIASLGAGVIGVKVEPVLN